MKSTSVDPSRLDVRSLIEQGASMSGVWPLHTLARLHGSVMADQTPAEAAIAWEVRGEARPTAVGQPEWWLRLSADADLALVCQRCLGPVREHVSVDRWLRFVADESQAAALDAELEDDVLALPRWLNLVDLVEDELLMALPLVPRHAVCPQPLPLPADPLAETPEPEPHPFAALAAIRGQIRK